MITFATFLGLSSTLSLGFCIFTYQRRLLEVNMTNNSVNSVFGCLAGIGEIVSTKTDTEHVDISLCVPELRILSF